MWLFTLILFFSLIKTAPADYLVDTARLIEAQWTQIRFNLPRAEQEKAYQPLLDLTGDLVKRYPTRVEANYWQAVVKLNHAEFESQVQALKTVYEARDLLDKVIALDPLFMEGSAYVILGTLYYRVPGWPIAFGDKDKAGKLLTKALEINPNGMDTNYFYGDFLLSQNRFQLAENYFNKALATPIQPDRMLGDSDLKQKAKIALENAKRQVNVHNPFARLFGR